MHMVRLLLTLLATLIVAACAAQPTSTDSTDAARAAAVVEPAADEEAKDSSTAEGDAMDMDAGDTHADGMDSDGGDDAATASETGGDEMAATEEMPADSGAVEAVAAEAVDEPAVAVDRPAWQQIALTDARTGQEFTLADYAGKTVFVEPFATWCSNCRRQLGNVQSAYAASGDEVFFIALSVEPNIGNDALVSYANNQGFDYTFAAMPPEMLQELAALFGQTIANPPATPHFIIRPDGTTTELVTGPEGPEALLQQLQAAGG